MTSTNDSYRKWTRAQYTMRRETAREERHLRTPRQRHDEADDETSESEAQIRSEIHERAYQEAQDIDEFEVLMQTLAGILEEDVIEIAVKERNQLHVGDVIRIKNIEDIKACGIQDERAYGINIQMSGGITFTSGMQRTCGKTYTIHMISTNSDPICYRLKDNRDMRMHWCFTEDMFVGSFGNDALQKKLSPTNEFNKNLL